MTDLDLEAIKAMLAALPDGFVLGVDGSYFDTRRLVANMWGEAEEDGDAGPCDPNDPALLAFRDAAIPTIAALVAEVEANRVEIAQLRARLPTGEGLLALDIAAKRLISSHPAKWTAMDAVARLSRVEEEADRG